MYVFEEGMRCKGGEKTFALKTTGELQHNFKDAFIHDVLKETVVHFASTTLDSSNFSIEGNTKTENRSSKFVKSRAALVGVFCFARQRNQIKDKFRSKVGRIYSACRYGMTLSGIRAVQLNRFGTFETVHLKSHKIEVLIIIFKQFATSNVMRMP